MNREDKLPFKLGALTLTMLMLSMGYSAKSHCTPLTESEGFKESHIVIDGIDRQFFIKQPTNFNGKAIVFLHAAESLAFSLVEDSYSLDLLRKLSSEGFLLVLPSARPTFGTKPYTPRWEHEVSYPTPDSHFIDWLLDQRTAFNSTAPKKIAKTYIGGLSSGAIMSTRMSSLRQDFDGIFMINGVGSDGAKLVKNIPVFWNTYQVNKSVPSFNLISTVDSILPYENKIAYTVNARDKGLSAEDCTVSGGFHQLGEWANPCYPNLISWLRR